MGGVAEEDYLFDESPRLIPGCTGANVDHLIIGVGDHRQQLYHLLATTSGVVRIVSPYVSESIILGDIGNREVRLLTAVNKKDIGFGATSLDALERLIDKGVKCRSMPDDPTLHAKVYIFGSESALVTSANFTKRALDDNIEVGSIVDEDGVQTLTAWFEKLWKTAKVLDAQRIAQLKQETAELRLACSDFRDKWELTGHADGPGPEPNPPTTPVSYFLCNTNRRYDPSRDCERAMKARGYAAAWNEGIPGIGTMRKVQPGDIVLLYENGVGIVAIGRAEGDCEEDWEMGPRRLVYREDFNPEFRIPVRWIRQVGDEDACRWPRVKQQTFYNVSSDIWRDQRNEVFRRFGCSELIGELGLPPLTGAK